MSPTCYCWLKVFGLLGSVIAIGALAIYGVHKYFALDDRDGYNDHFDNHGD